MSSLWIANDTIYIPLPTLMMVNVLIQLFSKVSVKQGVSRAFHTSRTVLKPVTCSLPIVL